MWWCIGRGGFVTRYSVFIHRSEMQCTLLVDVVVLMMMMLLLLLW